MPKQVVCPLCGFAQTNKYLSHRTDFAVLGLVFDGDQCSGKVRVSWSRTNFGFFVDKNMIFAGENRGWIWTVPGSALRRPDATEHKPDSRACRRPRNSKLDAERTSPLKTMPKTVKSAYSMQEMHFVVAPLNPLMCATYMPYWSPLEVPLPKLLWRDRT